MGPYRDHLVMKVEGIDSTLDLRWRKALVFLFLTSAMIGTAQVPPHEPVGSQVQFTNDVVVVNSSPWPVLVVATPKNEVLELQGSRFVLEAGKSMRIARYVTDNTFVSPVDLMTVTGTMTDRKGKDRTIGVLMMEKRRVDDHHRTWIYQVMGGGAGVGFGF